MTRKEKATRLYKFSDAMLKQLSDDVKGSLTRDLDDFAARNVTQAKLDAFGALIDDFDDIETDEEMRGDVSIAVQDRKASRDALYLAVSTIENMAANTWGEADAHYRQFGFGNMAQMDENEFARTAKRVGRVARKHLSKLENEGLTEPQLEQLETKRVAFDDAIDEVEDAIENRNLKTQERIDAGNDLYRELVRLTNIGKNIYIATNEAKYNDYVIYNTPGSQAPPPAAPAPAPDVAALEGVVIDNSDGEAVEGAIVTVQGTGLNATTEANGGYDIEGIAPGTYTVTVVKEGYQTATLTGIQLAGGQRTTMDVTLMNEQ